MTKQKYDWQVARNDDGAITSPKTNKKLKPNLLNSSS
jgi:hypothetical protein